MAVQKRRPYESEMDGNYNCMGEKYKLCYCCGMIVHSKMCESVSMLQHENNPCPILPLTNGQYLLKNNNTNHNNNKYM